MLGATPRQGTRCTNFGPKRRTTNNTQPMRRVLSYWWASLILSIGVLVVPTFSDPIDDSPMFRALSDLRILATAMDIFHEERGAYPTEDDGLAALVPTVILRIPADPWGNAYAYRAGPTAAASVYSIGMNKRDERGAGDDISTEQLSIERPGRVCDAYDKCARRLSGYGLLTLAILSLAVGIGRGFLRVRARSRH